MHRSMLPLAPSILNVAAKAWPELLMAAVPELLHIVSMRTVILAPAGLEGSSKSAAQPIVIPLRTLASVGFDPAAPVITTSPLPSTGTLAVVGSEPLLLVINSLTPASTLAASLRIWVLRELRCSAGTARKTINIISPATASTIMTSIIVKPPDCFFGISFFITLKSSYDQKEVMTKKMCLALDALRYRAIVA